MRRYSPSLSQFPAPETPRWPRRYSGILVSVVVFAVLGWAALHYARRTPPSGGRAPRVFHSQP
ncbi:MAG TPA: hypothetical protein VNW92_29095 [Polyangiaceae bacterium]|nr:hypothetical protein [Polyangiaceae bacterium]